jgi:hypothetical protein
MTYPSFTSGEVLTATDMNAVGLWLVKTQTIGTAVASVTVTDAFSSSYDNYIVTISGGANSIAGNALDLKFGATVTGYYFSMIFTSWNNVVNSAGQANVGRIDYVGHAGTQGLNGLIEINSPFLAKNTTVRASIQNSTNYGGTTNGFLNNTTSYTSFIIATTGGTMTGGTIRVYGMRN